VAETVLAPLGVRAIFFVCPGLMELNGEAQAAAVSANILRGLKPAPEPLMDWRGVERLKTLGHVIGSHTFEHRRLTELSADQRAEQVDRAAEALTTRLGETPDWFAYTFGDIDSIDAASLAEIGRRHRFCRSGVRGDNGLGTSLLALRADQVDLEASLAWQGLAQEGALALLYGERRKRLDAMAGMNGCSG
jgi:peptidoglycan/xylan/chitin deacetylase (PgdA/CDA1 family)